MNSPYRTFFQTHPGGLVSGIITQAAEALPPPGYIELDPDPPPGMEAMIALYWPAGRKRVADDIKGKIYDPATGLFADPPIPRGAQRKRTAAQEAEAQAAAARRGIPHALADIAAYIDAATLDIKGTRSKTEELTWDAKGAAAGAIAAAEAVGEALPAAGRERLMMRIEAALMGETEGQVTAKIADKAERFFIVGPAISAERRRHEARVRQAVTPDAVDGENALARRRVDLVIAGWDALRRDPEAFAATLPQEPDDLGTQ